MPPARPKKGQKLYDVMRDSYEKGFDMESLDAFFDSLRRERILFLKKLTESGVQIEAISEKRNKRSWSGFRRVSGP